jgi:hypothetical protein
MMPSKVGNMDNNMDKERDRMSAPEIMRSFIAALLLGPGLVVAAGSETVTPNEPPTATQMAPAVQQDIAPSAAMWLPMMPVARPQVYYWAPPPGMMWPVLPQYPAPMAMPPVVWVMVPVPAASLTPAQVDYGPVADTPVVELPLLDAAMTQTMMEDAALAAALAKEGNADIGPAAVASGVEMPSSAGMNTQPPATGADEASTLAVAAPANVAPVDYGPVTPTPVVDLLALQTQVAGSGAPESSQATAKSGHKSGTPASPMPIPKVKSAPAKRMCWSKGVVAPCR